MHRAEDDIICGQKDQQRSFLSKTNGLLDSHGELLSQRFVVLVRRKIYSIEAGVGLRQLVGIAGLLHGKPSRSVGTLQVLEAVNGDTGGTGCKLEQPGPLVALPLGNALPEPLDDLVGLLVAPVIGVSLPVIDVNVGETTDEQLELPLVEDLDQILRNELVETVHKGLELLLDGLGNDPLGLQLDELLLVVVGDVNVASVRFQVDDFFLAEVVDLNGESLKDDVGDVVGQHPAQRAVHL